MVRFWQLQGVGPEQETVYTEADNNRAQGDGSVPQSGGSGLSGHYP
jgi:hypothetical protein